MPGPALPVLPVVARRPVQVAGQHAPVQVRCLSRVVHVIGCLSHVLSLQPFLSLVGGAGTVRDEHSGKLTDYGRQLIVEGREKCHVQDILEPRALSRDPLELPICSYEWKFLALLLIALSKRLNAHFHLPQDNQQIMCSWPVVLRRARQRQPAGDFLYPVKVAHQCFRFNLRFLASYRVFSTTAIMFLLGAYRLGLVPVITLLVVFSLLALVAWQNGIAID